MWAWYTILGYFVLALLVPVFWAMSFAYNRAVGARVVTCPGGNDSASVELDAWHAARMHLLGNPEGSVRACSRWPERGGCRQECLTQIGLPA